MRMLPFVALSLLMAAALFAQAPKTSVATPPPDVAAPPADAIHELRPDPDADSAVGRDGIRLTIADSCSPGRGRAAG